MEKLLKPFIKAPWYEKSPDGRFWAIEHMRNCLMFMWLFDSPNKATKGLAEALIEATKGLNEVLTSWMAGH